jgi:CheY-like chemotaxis protein
LILLDLNMPVMDGREFLVWLAQQMHIKLGVIVISGQTRGVVLGAKAILRKPFDLLRLLCLMHHLTDG